MVTAPDPDHLELFVHLDPDLPDWLTAAPLCHPPSYCPVEELIRRGFLDAPLCDGCPRRRKERAEANPSHQ